MDIAFKFMDVGLEAFPSQGFAHDNNQEGYVLSFTCVVLFSFKLKITLKTRISVHWFK